MSAIGALLGLALAIFLIIRKVSTVYSLMLGALAGGLIGGMDLPTTVSTMISGVNEVTPAIVRVLAAGVLSGVLVVCGGAASIAGTIVTKLGQKRVFLAMALATMLLTAVGVFIDVAVITIAPVALILAQHLKLSRGALLLMMIGGGKCGNIISPNPNTIIAAENFHADLYNVMYANLLPAVIGLIFTVWIIGRLVRRFPDGADIVRDSEAKADSGEATDSRPGFLASISGPVAAILLLALRPLCGVSIDPLVALPVGGIVGVAAMRRWRLLGRSIAYGLDKMAGVSLLLIGTGTIAGIIKASTIKDLLLNALSGAGIGEELIAPVSGMLMSAATASTTAGATVASSSFADVILAAGVSGVWGAAMVNAGATVFDHMPHGSFFHATGGVTRLSFGHRMRLIPYESAIGFVLAASSTATAMLL